MEALAVSLIVAVAGFLSIRSIYRIFSGRNKGCGCMAGSCSLERCCPSIEICVELDEKNEMHDQAGSEENYCALTTSARETAT